MTRWTRRALALGGLASLAGGLILLPAASRSAAAVTGAPAAGAPAAAAARHGIGSPGVTVTGPHLYDPATGKPFTSASTVTVSGTRGLVNQLVSVSWANFTPSVLAPGQPWYAYNGGAPTSYSVMVAECRGTSPQSWTDCSGATNAGVPIPRDSNGIVNTAYAITTAKGTGGVPFDIQTSQQNKPLGCGRSQPCSLVIVPGQGGAPGNCSDHTQDLGAVGTAAPGQTFQPATGACSWARRIVIPLTFAPVPTGCPLRNPVFSSAGSPMLAGAMQQWLTGLCPGRNGLTIAYNSQDGEPLAVSEAVNGSANIAFTTRPASAQGVAAGNSHFAYAPVAVSAVSIAYWIDNNNTGQVMSGLKLNQRLMAKLLTTSYASSFSDDRGVRGNPYSIFAPNPGGDPEFQQLNPQIFGNVQFFTSQPYVVPDIMQGGSDMTWTLTRWIAADPTARGFLTGKTAPGGMHVNSYYRGVHYPTNTFTAQDPSPEYLHLFNPEFGLANVVNFQAINDFPGDSWVKDTFGNYPALPAEPVGNRALIAVLDQADAALNRFPVAAIPNAAGRYVLPSQGSMAAALSHMISDGNGTSQVNLASKDPKAYPLTMVIYAVVPTSGMCHAAAAGVARFLDFAAGPGQTPGLRPGQLPPGYLPLTASLRATTHRVARQVSGESCKSGSGGGSGSGQGPTPAPSPNSSLNSSPSPGPSVSLPAPAEPGPQIAFVNQAHVQPAGIGRFVLPALLILAGLAALAGSSMLVGSLPGGAATAARRVRRGAATQGRRVRRAAAGLGSGAKPPGRTIWRKKP